MIESRSKEELFGLAAALWCTPPHRDIVLDTVLAEKIGNLLIEETSFKVFDKDLLKDFNGFIAVIDSRYPEGMFGSIKAVMLVDGWMTQEEGHRYSVEDNMFYSHYLILRQEALDVTSIRGVG